MAAAASSADPMVRLSSAFIDALVDEARREDGFPAAPSQGDANTLLLATLHLDQAAPALFLTYSLTLAADGRLLSATSATSSQPPEQRMTTTPCVEIASSTLEQLLTKQMNPMSAFARGLVKIRGDRSAWRSLAGPARRAAARVAPLLEAKLPWPTFSNVQFKPPSEWVDDATSPFCQVCGGAFSLLVRRHHCRVCGRVVCHGCSTHQLSDHRACDPCFFKHVAAPPLSPIGPASGSSSRTPVDLVEKMRAKLATKEAEPVPCTKSSSTERTLRARALASLDETRRLRRDVDAMREPVAASLVSAALRHSAYVFGLLYAWRGVLAMGFWSPWWASVVAATSLACQPHSLVGLVLALSSASSSPSVTEAADIGAWKWLIPGIVAGAGVALVHRALQRLVRIYSTSISIILFYQCIRVFGQRILKLSDPAQEELFARVDIIVAPWICQEILELKSVFTKFGQVLGARADIVPPSWQVVLSRLQDDMPSDPLHIVEQTMREDKVELSSIDPKSVASASIAQVHRGTLKGAPVAVKIQHHDVAGLMRNDMVAFRRIVAFSAWLNPRFQVIVQLLDAWEKEMMKELDFENEASNLRKVGEHLKHLDLVIPVPLVATQRVLVMQWIDGFKITDNERLDLFGVDRQALLGRIVQAYSYQLFVDGLFNADPHPGNIFVSVDESTGVARPVLLDFGMVVTLPAPIRLGYCALVHALSSLSVSGVSEAIRRAGYQNTQSNAHPERDLEFFAHLLRDTGSREEQREQAKSFDQLRRQQRKGDEAASGGRSVEGRAFKEFPDSLIFLLRTLGLLRGLCTQLAVPVSYLEGMIDHARLGLALAEQRPSRPRVPRGPIGDPVMQRAIEAALHQSSSADVLEGGVQVCVRQGGRVLALASAGTMGDVDPRNLTDDCLMALLDLTKLLASMAVLRCVGKGIDLDSPLTGPKGAGPTLRMTLCHAKTGMEDAIPPSSFAHQLMNYDRCLSEVVRHAGEAESQRSAPDGASYHTHSFGWELDLSLRNSVDPCTLYDLVQGSIPAELRDELLFGDMPPEADERTASVSHGFAGMARTAFMSGEAGMGGGGGGGATLSLDLGTRALPGRAFADPMMANTRAVRASRLPSFNAYGSARALADMLERMMGSLPRKVVKEMSKVHAKESNSLLGQVEWGLGWQVVHSSRGRLALVHHVTMGGLAIHIPDTSTTIVVLVSDLTVERTVVKNATRAALMHEPDLIDAVLGSTEMVTG